MIRTGCCAPEQIHLWTLRVGPRDSVLLFFLKEYKDVVFKKNGICCSDYY